MNKFEKYFYDPDIVDEPTALREIHAIRLMLHEEIRSLTPEERTAHTIKIANGIMEKYGLTHLRAIT